MVSISRDRVVRLTAAGAVSACAVDMSSVSTTRVVGLVEVSAWTVGLVAVSAWTMGLAADTTEAGWVAGKMGSVWVVGFCQQTVLVIVTSWRGCSFYYRKRNPRR